MAEDIPVGAHMSKLLKQVDADMASEFKDVQERTEALRDANLEKTEFAPPKQRPTTVDVRLVIRTREALNGDLAIYANILRRFHGITRDCPNWHKMGDTHKVAIDEIVRSLTCALVGDVDSREPYDDLAGYALSAAERLTPRT